MGWTLCLVVAVLDGVRYRLEGEDCDGAEDLVARLCLSGVYDQLSVPNLCCLEEVARRVCQCVKAYESGSARES